MAKHALKEAQPTQHTQDVVETTANLIDLAAHRRRNQPTTVIDRDNTAILMEQSWHPGKKNDDIRATPVLALSATDAITKEAERLAWNEQSRERRYDASPYIKPSKREQDYQGNRLLTHGHDNFDADDAAQKEQWQDRVEHHRQQVLLAHEMTELANQTSVTEQLPKAS